MITINDVAKLAKVSKGTISRYLNGTLKPKPETIERIETAIKETNYVPNKVAASIKTKTSNTIAIVIPASKNVIFAEIGDAINDEIAKEGYSMVTYTTNDTLELEKLASSKIRENRLGGAIFITEPKGDKDMSHINLLEESGIKTVLINRFYKPNEYTNISIDCYSGGREVIRYLNSVGYKKIGIILGWEKQDQSKQYKNAFIDEYKNLGLDFDSSLIRYCYFDEEATINIVEELISSGVDAIFTISDRSALTALDVVEKKEIRIPDDIGIIGYGNSQFSKLVKMSSLDGRGEDIGTIAAGMLLKKIKGLEEEKFRLLETNVVVRKTTKR